MRAKALHQLVSEDSIIPLSTNKREEAIGSLCDLLGKQGKFDPQICFEAAMKRESVTSTGIGLAIAIPHARIKHLDKFYLAIGYATQGGIPWDAIDGEDVRLVFLILGPDSNPTEYLQLLSQITQMFKDDNARKELFQIHTPQEIARFIKSYHS